MAVVTLVATLIERFYTVRYDSAGGILRRHPCNPSYRMLVPKLLPSQPCMSFVLYCLTCFVRKVGSSGSSLYGQKTACKERNTNMDIVTQALEDLKRRRSQLDEAIASLALLFPGKESKSNVMDMGGHPAQKSRKRKTWSVEHRARYLATVTARKKQKLRA